MDRGREVVPDGKWRAVRCKKSLLPSGDVQRDFRHALTYDVQLEVSLLSEHRDADVERMLLEEQIGLSEWDLEIQQPDVRQKRRQDRVIHAQTRVRHIHRQPQT